MHPSVMMMARHPVGQNLDVDGLLVAVD